MVKVKICGITNLEDARSAIQAGCDALGFVFYHKSPRYITPEKAAVITGQLPKSIKKVGVFVNASEKCVRAIARKCRLDWLQFHAEETPEFCRRFKGYRVIKAFRVKDDIDLEEIKKYKACVYLFDAFNKRKFGGTGRVFDIRLLKGLKGIKRPVFLSGGLTCANVKKAIAVCSPQWVDVSSSVEIRPGKKDRNKIIRFIKASKG